MSYQGAVRPPPPWAGDLEQLRREILSEVDQKLKGLSMGLEAHIKAVVLGAADEALAPHLAKLAKLDAVDRLLELAERQELREEERERARQEAEEARAREDAHVERLLGHREKAITVVDKRIDGDHRRRNAVIGLLVAVVSAGSALLAAVLSSHK